MKIRAALAQVGWAGTKDAMVERHVKYIAEAAAGGAFGDEAEACFGCDRDECGGGDDGATR